MADKPYALAETEASIAVRVKLVWAWAIRMCVPIGRPKAFFKVILTSIAVTEMLVALALFDGPICSFKVMEPRPARLMVVLGEGVPEMGMPAITSPTKVELLLLDALLRVTVLLATELMAVAEIRPESSVTFWMVVLAWMLALLVVRLVVALSLRVPELAKPPRPIEAAEALVFWLESAHPSETGKSGPTLAMLEPAGTLSDPAYAEPPAIPGNAPELLLAALLALAGEVNIINENTRNKATRRMSASFLTDCIAVFLHAKEPVPKEEGQSRPWSSGWHGLGHM
jgi:hypothetical protein